MPADQPSGLSHETPSPDAAGRPVYTLKVTARFEARDDIEARRLARGLLGETVESLPGREVRCVRHGDRTGRNILG